MVSSVSMALQISLMSSGLYPSLSRAMGTVLFTILSIPPPAKSLYFTSAISGSTPVVSQSIRKPMVPVGARTVAWALRKPDCEPASKASSQAFFAALSM